MGAEILKIDQPGTKTTPPGVRKAFGGRSASTPLFRGTLMLIYVSCGTNVDRFFGMVGTFYILLQGVRGYKVAKTCILYGKW